MKVDFVGYGALSPLAVRVVQGVFSLSMLPVIMMMSSLFLVASSVEDDDGLTRPGAKRVRLWRDRPPEGAFPRSSNAKAAKALCAAGLQNYKIQGGQQSPLFMAMGKSPAEHFEERSFGFGRTQRPLLL